MCLTNLTNPRPKHDQTGMSGNRMIQSTLGFHPVGGGARGGATAARGSGGARTGNDGGRESSSGSDDESQVGGGGGGDGGAEAGQIPKWAKRAGLSAAHVFGAVSKLMQTFEPKKGRGQKPFDRGGAEGKGVFPFGSMMVEPPDPIISHFGPLMKDTVRPSSLGSPSASARSSCGARPWRSRSPSTWTWCRAPPARRRCT